MGEFDEIARLFRPLARGTPGAFDLLDDAAVIPSRPGFDLVVTKDALVEGVHFLSGDPLDLVARKLLRVNLSDLAAKAAEPYAAFLAIAWPPTADAAAREAFARGLGEDLERFGVVLLGGDTVSTPGPLTASLTLTGWTPEDRMVRRMGARAGDVLLVSGTVGDGALGLLAARGEIDSPALLNRYQLPQPRLDLRGALRRFAQAAADVSDGLLADAGHVAWASGVGVEVVLEAAPLSADARRWMEAQPERKEALLRLATGGDDYEVVAACAPDAVKAFVEASPIPLTVVGRFTTTSGVRATLDGEPVAVGRTGWTHG